MEFTQQELKDKKVKYVFLKDYIAGIAYSRVDSINISNGIESINAHLKQMEGYTLFHTKVTKDVINDFELIINDEMIINNIDNVNSTYSYISDDKKIGVVLPLSFKD
jgi:hypothetical protein